MCARPHRSASSGPEALAAAITRARRIVERIELVQLDDVLLDVAAELRIEPLRSLDAIHLAAAQHLGDDLSVLVSYDERMVAAATALGLPVASPS